MASSRLPRFMLKNLLEWVRTTEEIDVLREILEWIAQQLMEEDVTAQGCVSSSGVNVWFQWVCAKF